MFFYTEDIGVQLNFTVWSVNKNPTDLTGATVELFVRTNARSPFPLTITNAKAGKCQYITQAGDFPIGTYVGTIRVTRSPSQVFNAQGFQIDVGSIG
jgi:hypothetical protein